MTLIDRDVNRTVFDREKSKSGRESFHPEQHPKQDCTIPDNRQIFSVLEHEFARVKGTRDDV